MVHAKLEPSHGDFSIPATLARLAVLAGFCLGTGVLLAAVPTGSGVPATPCHFGSSSGATGGARRHAMVQALLTPRARETHKILVTISGEAASSAIIPQKWKPSPRQTMQLAQGPEASWWQNVSQDCP